MNFKVNLSLFLIYFVCVKLNGEFGESNLLTSMEDIQGFDWWNSKLLIETSTGQ